MVHKYFLLLVVFITTVLSAKIEEDIADPELLDLIKNCFPETPTTSPGPKIPVGITEKQNELTLSLLKKVYASERGENVFYSSYSIYHSLMMSFFISNGSTEAGIRNLLNFPAELSKAKIVEAYKLEEATETLTVFNNLKDFIISSGSKLFVRSDIEIRDCMELLFEIELYPLDFLYGPKSSADYINNWILERTNFQLRKFVSPSDFGPDTKLFLGNGIFFKGGWESKFPVKGTKEKTFQTFGGPVPVKMMEKLDTFEYGFSHKLNSKVLKLPFKGGDISMFVILPDSPDQKGLDDVISNFDVECLNECVSGNHSSKTEVLVQFPKFTVEKPLILTEHFKNLGIGDLFQPTADLSDLTGSKNIYLNMATHRAKIIVDEKGATLLSTTAFRHKRSANDPVSFVCDHPFLYFIFDSLMSTVLFVGVYTSP